MKVIFKRDLAKIGKKYQVKNVSNGYAINFLIPNGYAVAATPQAEKELETLKMTMGAEKNIQDSLLQKNLKTISETKLTIASKANEKGHLFSGIHKEQIITELQSQMHIGVPTDFVHLEKPLKEIGEHKVKIGSEDKNVTLMVHIVAA